MRSSTRALLVLSCLGLGASSAAAGPGELAPVYRASLDLALADFDGGTTASIVSVPVDRAPDPGGDDQNIEIGGGQGRKPVVIESMQVTCNGADTCDGTTTCNGQPTCNGTITCNGADTCDGSTTCNGAETCNGVFSCNGSESCDGTQTCNGTGTCTGTATCQDTCSGFHTCTAGCNTLVSPDHGHEGPGVPDGSQPLDLLVASALVLGSLTGGRQLLGLA